MRISILLLVGLRTEWYPNEVTEAEDENGNASKSHHISQVAVESLDEVRKHGSERQRSKTLGESDTGCGGDTETFPFRAPVLVSSVSDAR